MPVLSLAGPAELASAPPALAAEIDPAASRLYVVIGGVDPYQRQMLGARLQSLTPLLTVEHSGDSTMYGAFSVPLTWPAVVQLVTEFGASWRPGPRLQEWTRTASEQASAAPSSSVTYAPPERVPFSWQQQAQALIADRRRVFLLDEMGAGKTGSALLGLEEAGAFPAVVFAPASMVDTWLDEAAIWLPHRSAAAYRGPGRRRLGQRDLYITSFDTGKLDPDQLLKRELRGFVVDELHLIKTPSSARAKAARKIAAKVGVFIGLGATPITHSVGDLHTALTCLQPGAWPDKERWATRYCLTIAGDYAEKIIGLKPHREPEFRLTIAGRERRVAKADVLAELPPKLYVTRHVEIPAPHRKVYDDMAANMLIELTAAEQAGERRSVMDQLTQLMRLNQLASSACDVWTEPKVDANGDQVLNPITGDQLEVIKVEPKSPSWKVEALLEILDERGPDASPVVVFAPSRKLIMMAGAAAEQAGRRVGYVVGGQSHGDRQRTVRAFQAGRLDVLCATTGAGGVGLTLTAADTVIFLQRPWSFVDASQAEDRLHRPGAEQHDSITVIDIVTKNSIDSDVRAVLRTKAGALSDLLQDSRIADQLFRKAK